MCFVGKVLFYATSITVIRTNRSDGNGMIVPMLLDRTYCHNVLNSIGSKRDRQDIWYEKSEILEETGIKM